MGQKARAASRHPQADGARHAGLTARKARQPDRSQRETTHSDAAPPSDGVRRRTGDAGVVTDGRLTVLRRTADTITLRDGAAVHPEPIERALCRSPYITDALVVGDRHSFPGCLVRLEPDAVEGWAHAKRVPFSGFADLANTAQLRALLLTEIDRAKKSGGARLADPCLPHDCPAAAGRRSEIERARRPAPGACHESVPLTDHDDVRRGWHTA